jgi:C4-dicarboxylate-specific signal transduction histidine kinase
MAGESESGVDIPPGQYAVIEIQDKGEGMDNETSDRIFEPFFTTKFFGRGLGMAAAYGIIQEHGGGK